MAYTTIDDSSAHHQTALYTGTGSSLSITNGGNSDLQPDLIWVKKRADATESHWLSDSSRGSTVYNQTDSTNAEADISGGVSSFNSDGFTVGGEGIVNDADDTYVAWQWKANGGTSTGSASESGDNPAYNHQANTTAGFSIITYTGTGATGTITHGLGVVPEVIICKQRSNAESWGVYHHKNTAAPETDFLLLDTTAATADNSNRWGDTAPTSSVFTVDTANEVNTDARTYVAYVFTPIQGYSKFGGYTANNNADGTFVYTGFKPAWLLIKRTSGTENWVLWDNARDPFNNFYHVLLPNATSVEDTSNAGSGGRYIGDFLSNGFKLRNTHDTSNSASDYVYMAFAEQPFVTSGGVPATAR